MIIHLHKEIEKLKKQLLTLCAVVEQGVRDSVRAITGRDTALAQRVIEGDRAIDQAEIDVEEECLKILALYQPVAIDLRFLVAVLKMNNDLERIGDLAVNIAQRAILLNTQLKIAVPFDLNGLAEKTQTMFRQSLDALVNLDAGLARRVCAMDDEVDAINRQMYDGVKAMIRRQPEHLDALIALLSISRYLERIADHATNIAEDVLYT
ncbi:MAG: phosphate signaling complex protein PhoU, partial [Verrucomicrobia bacterium]|nr:phosphate signaling complex protein PhoU [Verrucomicrobiota bacterium]